MRFRVIFILLLSLATCKKENAVTEPEFLKSTALFPIGAAIDYGRLKNSSLYKKTVTDEYTSITPENAMKWFTIHPSKDKFDFTEADYIVDFSLSEHNRIHGHTLLWYFFQDIEWVKNFVGDSAQWEQMIKNHIQTEVSHFKGKISSWDVVNEAFRDDDGSLRVEDRNPSIFDDGSIFARKVGRDYIARAFQYAHEADPDALLFYNEYGQEWSTEKIQSILAMVTDFKKRSVPIHGLGIQLHTDINASTSGIENALRELATTGLKIHISELDISVNPKSNSPFDYTDNIKQLQYNKYKFIVSAYRRIIPADQQYGITTWNVGDADSWIRGYLKRTDYPLLFDDSYQRKKTYQGFLDGLKN